MNAIGIGSVVTLHYTLELADGTPVDSSLGGEPLTFTIGDGTLARGLELSLYGLRAGDHQRIEIGCRDAWGVRQAGRVERLPLECLENPDALETGAVVEFQGDDEVVLGRIVSLDAQTVGVDFNHPLAGHDVFFEVWVVAVGECMPVTT